MDYQQLAAFKGDPYAECHSSAQYEDMPPPHLQDMQPLSCFALNQVHGMKKQIMLVWPTYFPLPFPVRVISSDGMSS